MATSQGAYILEEANRPLTSRHSGRRPRPQGRSRVKEEGNDLRWPCKGRQRRGEVGPLGQVKNLGFILGVWKKLLEDFK